MEIANLKLSQTGFYRSKPLGSRVFSRNCARLRRLERKGNQQIISNRSDRQEGFQVVGYQDLSFAVQIVILRKVPGSGSRSILGILLLTFVLFEFNVVLQEFQVGSALNNVNKEPVTLLWHMHNQRWTLWTIWKLSTI
ncbi:hypothetical protein HanXRQr2_Chr16g0735261 [Helianthus annuus]|uniref:Uncharacterized protein n=1 Tax=Helianthus annuus TaxID=4232 RepID=A0A251RXM0_HELAN|nr:hypothetical protein HanXRQr2_Chr16g0735261 [Helianthus annuus]KAJ0820224.1 hypothetical protein HanPSC8_Chr16g0705391 [Helianthus annuus]